MEKITIKKMEKDHEQTKPLDVCVAQFNSDCQKTEADTFEDKKISLAALTMCCTCDQN